MGIEACYGIIIIKMEGESLLRKAGKLANLAEKQKMVAKTVNYDDKLGEAQETNAKLKELWQIIRRNTQGKRVEASQVNQSPDSHHLTTLQKRHKKLMGEMQQLTNNLNWMINENNKLKGQVDSSRNSRVIYWNVYKTLEKEIHKNEYLYRVALVDSLCYEETDLKVKDKLENAVRKLEKEIGELSGGMVKKKNMKRKSRLDTGLSTIRESKLGTRFNSSADLKVSLGQSLSSRRDEVQESLSTRKELIEVKPVTNEQEHEHPADSDEKRRRDSGGMKSAKSLKGRNRMQVTEDLNQYYDLEMKSNYYDNILIQLRGICGGETMGEMSDCWNTVDGDIGREYESYMAAEEEIKVIEQEMETLGHQKGSVGQRGEGKTAEEMELEEVEREMAKEKDNLGQLEGKLTGLIDLNCQRLSDEEISNHILRIKRRAGSNPRQLQKLLEGVKEKNVAVSGSRVSNKGGKSRKL